MIQHRTVLMEYASIRLLAVGVSIFLFCVSPTARAQDIEVVTDSGGLVLGFAVLMKAVDLLNHQSSRHQKGQGTYAIKIPPALLEEESVPYAEWVPNSTLAIRPTTSKGTNMRVTGVAVRLNTDGTVELDVDKYANVSRHSDWRTRLALVFARESNGKIVAVDGAIVNFALGKLAHGKTKRDLALKTRLKSPVALSGDLRIIVRIYADRYR